MSICLYKQSGVALLTALLIVVVATVTAVAMTARQQLDIYRTSNLINHEQAYLYLLGAEEWAQQTLIRDARKTRIDSLDEMWAMRLPALSILGGTVQGQLYDLHRCFNINNLVKTDGKVSEPHQAYFERLLKLLDISPILAQQLIDWIDRDKIPQLPNGAEDNTYLIKEKAYRVANQALHHRSELRLLANMTQADYIKLAPYVCVLPTVTQININTAPLELFLSLHDDLKVEDIQVLLTQREQKAFDSVNDFIQHQALAGLEIDVSLLSVKSMYFNFIGRAEVGGGSAQLNSIFQREHQKVYVVFRTQHDESLGSKAPHFINTP